METAGPDFVGVGVQKSASSWISDVLDQHPDVWVPKKEINFFVAHFHEGWAWYERWFEGRGARLAGEFSVAYFLSPRPERRRKQRYPRGPGLRVLSSQGRETSARDALFDRYPRVKVLVVLRDPAERAWSYYWYWRARQEARGRPVVPFERMFADDGRWIRTTGLYASRLAHWRERFPDLGVFLHDDVRDAPAELARALYRYLGVDDSFVPELRRRVNATPHAPLPPELRRRVLDEAYRAEIERLAAELDRDLSAWL